MLNTLYAEISLNFLLILIISALLPLYFVLYRKYLNTQNYVDKPTKVEQINITMIMIHILIGLYSNLKIYQSKYYIH